MDAQHSEIVVWIHPLAVSNHQLGGDDGGGVVLFSDPGPVAHRAIGSHGDGGVDHVHVVFVWEEGHA